MSFSVKFNQQDIKNVEDNVRKAFDKVIKSDKMLGEVGQVIVEDVVKQTQDGKSIPLKADLKLLKEKWITRKSKIAGVNNPDQAYEEGKSNLTFTGQLLRAFSWTVQGPGKILLSFKGKHKPYKNIDGTPSPDQNLTNEQLAKYVAQAGRPFVGVRPAMRLRINRIVKTYVKRALVVARLNKQ